MGEIYKITNLLNGKCYIGQTKHSAQIRWKDHINGYHPSSLIHKAITKYGVNNFSFEILCENVDVNKLNELEIQFISRFNSKTPHGYNLTDGGDGFKGVIPTEKWRYKQSISHKGKPWSISRRLAGQKKLVGNNNAGKPVVMLDKITNAVLKQFKSATQASIETGIERSTIQKCASGNRPTAGGFAWKFI